MRHLVISAGLVLAAATVASSAPTPFGGDDSGFIPQNKLTLKCEESIAKAVGKAGACIGKCTAARADGKLADDVAEDACEKLNAGKSCLELFDAAVTKAQAKDTTLECNCIVGPSLAGVIEADLDSMNDLVYCNTTSGTPFGGDDSGDIPVAGSSTGKCEDTVNKLVGKATACIIKCHAGRASGKLADDTAEDACEKNNLGKSCLEKFAAGVTKAQAADTSGGCNCINGASLANTIESVLDGGNSLTYCASPSGAFVE